MVAALFVRKKNHYAALGCDCYDIDRDALSWPGGEPGIFHPPCRAWGQLSHFAKPRPGEVELSLWAMQKVRQFGGVLVPVLQSWWGHRAPKKSCLYIVGPAPDLPYLPETVSGTTVERMGRPERERTPQAFAAWLVDLARAC